MASYPIPPWLNRPSDPAAEFTSAFHAGSAVAMEQARLQQDAQQAAMAAASKAEVARQDALQNQQRLEIEKHYQQSQIGLKKQALDQAQQKIQAAAQGAARKFAEQQAIKDDIAAGVPHAAAFLRHPGAFSSMAGVAPLAKQEQERINPFVPSGMIEPVTGSPMVQRAPGQWERGAPTDRGPTVTAPLTDNPFGPKISGRLTDPSVRKALGTNAPLLDGQAPAVPPMPKEKKDLVKGQKYQTKRGIATWDGEHFVKE